MTLMSYYGNELCDIIVIMKEEFIVKAFAKKVREIRKSKGLTMEKLAELCDVDYRQIARIECGQINTSISMAYRISNAFSIQMTDLFNFDQLD